jgi:hypothetical protein
MPLLALGSVGSASNSRMLRLTVAACYGAALLITVLSLVGVFMVESGRGIVIGGWAFCTALLARGDPDK